VLHRPKNRRQGRTSDRIDRTSPTALEKRLARVVADGLAPDDFRGAQRLEKGLGRLFARARSRGVHTSFDVGAVVPEKHDALRAHVLPQTSLALPSLTEAQAITRCETPEDCAKALVDQGAEKAVIKCDAKGACLYDGSRITWVPSFRVPVVDTTGAGDTFVAAFLAALTRGEPLAACARFANAAAALCIQGTGATAGAQSHDEVLAFIEQQANG